jgi:hypothetical protein
LRPIRRPPVKHLHRAIDAENMFRSHILPALAALWGALIAINAFITGTDGSGAYGSGQIAAGVLGIAMVIVGVRTLMNAQKT